MSAALCPVLRGTLRSDGATTTLDWELRPIRNTVGLLGGWVIVIVVWSVWLIRHTLYASEPLTALWIFWTALVAATVSAAVIGWKKGGAALITTVPWLQKLAAGDPHLADDWG